MWRTPRSTASSLYKKQFSDDEKDVFFCHLNEIDHIHLLDDYGKAATQPEDDFIRKDPRTGRIITKETYEHSTCPKVTLFANFRQRSSMNSHQHQVCLNAMTKLGRADNSLSMSDRTDIRTYAQLSIERQAEKKQFLDFVKDEFYKRNIKNCFHLQPELNTFVTKRLQRSMQMALASMNDSFRLQSALPITHNGGSGDPIVVEHEKMIHRIGVALAINANKYSNPVQVSSSFLEHFYSNHGDVVVPIDEPFLQHHSVDVVINVKTITSIVTSAKIHSVDWNVPFKVTACEDKNVIIFDDKLPALSVSCLEKNRLAYKYGVKALVVLPKKKEVFSFEENLFIQRHPPTIAVSDTSNATNETAPSYKLWHFEEYLTKFCHSTASENTASDSNHIRRLWNIKRNGHNSCRMVIDSSEDYCEKRKDGTVKFINLSPKLEYQCEFGAEQMTLAELIEEWCALRFGPDTVVHRGKHYGQK